MTSPETSPERSSERERAFCARMQANCPMLDRIIAMQADIASLKRDANWTKKLVFANLSVLIAILLALIV